MIEVTQLVKYFGCGVCKRHSGQYTMAHTECLYPVGRMIEDTKPDECFGCVVAKKHSGRYKIAHKGVCIPPTDDYGH